MTALIRMAPAQAGAILIMLSGGMLMTIQEMADFLRGYEQERRLVNDPIRYSVKVSSCEACPHVFGMDFPAIMGAPDGEKAAVSAP